jgi:hypothetical protein
MDRDLDLDLDLDMDLDFDPESPLPSCSKTGESTSIPSSSCPSPCPTSFTLSSSKPNLSNKLFPDFPPPPTSFRVAPPLAPSPTAQADGGVTPPLATARSRAFRPSSFSASVFGVGRPSSSTSSLVYTTHGLDDLEFGVDAIFWSSTILVPDPPVVCTSCSVSSPSIPNLVLRFSLRLCLFNAGTCSSSLSHSDPTSPGTLATGEILPTGKVDDTAPEEGRGASFNFAGRTFKPLL